MRIKNNKIDIVHMWNIVMEIVELINVLVSFINLHFLSKTILTINFTIIGMHFIFAIVEFLSIKHNEKVILKLYGRMEK